MRISDWSSDVCSSDLWVDQRLPLPRLVYNAVGAGYPVPRNLNYFWNFGVLAGFALVLQIVTGIVLAMHYAANTAVAFDSVEHIMRNVNSGWLLRYAHANGASFFFIVVYIHIFRGLYYGSYKPPREVVRSEEHTPELQSLMRTSNAVFDWKKKNNNQKR